MRFFKNKEVSFIFQEAPLNKYNLLGECYNRVFLAI